MHRIVSAIFMLLVATAASGADATLVRKLAMETGMPDEVIRMTTSFGTHPVRLVGRNQDDIEVPAKGVSVNVAAASVSMVVAQLKRMLGSGYIVFVSNQGFGIKGNPDQVSVLMSNDQFDVVRVMGTNGDNHELSRDEILQKLKEWDRKYGLVITGAGFDWVEAKFKRTPTPMLPFAKIVYKFCPDVVEQGTETVEKLALAMQASDSVYLWWD